MYALIIKKSEMLIKFNTFYITLARSHASLAGTGQRNKGWLMILYPDYKSRRKALRMFRLHFKTAIPVEGELIIEEGKIWKRN